MTPTTHPSAELPSQRAEKALTLALRLAHAENALHAFTTGQVDAIVDPDGHAYLLRPAQEHVRQNERRLQAVIDCIADAIMVVDRGGVTVSQNRAVRWVLGYEPEEVLGTGFFALIHDEDLGEIYSAFFDVIEGFRENATARFRHLAPDGSYRYIEATVGRLGDSFPQSVVLSLRPSPSHSQKDLLCRCSGATSNKEHSGTAPTGFYYDSSSPHR